MNLHPVLSLAVDDEVAKVIGGYLISAPEQGNWLWEDHCDGLAGGIVVALRDAGFLVICGTPEATETNVPAAGAWHLPDNWHFRQGPA